MELTKMQEMNASGTSAALDQLKKTATSKGLTVKSNDAQAQADWYAKQKETDAKLANSEIKPVNQSDIPNIPPPPLSSNKTYYVIGGVTILFIVGLIIYKTHK